MTSDGHKLRETWNNALNDALAAFRDHLTNVQTSSWKRIPFSSRNDSSGSDKGKLRATPRPDVRDVAVYRKTTKNGDVYRVILDVPATEDTTDLEAWRATVATPELRSAWDPSVESAQVLEMFDLSTRIVKTNFTLGWPANPRDAVMISRSLYDDTTLVDISTSLPRSPDEPSYLRPSPPYVRSHVDLFAWCIQLLDPEARAKRVRMTCFWKHDLKTVWNIGVPASIPQQLATMNIGLLDIVKKRRYRTPMLTAYGLGVSIERVSFDPGRASLTIDYSIVPDDQEHARTEVTVNGYDELSALKEQRRLQRGLELLLPSPDGWDVRIATRASSDEVAKLPWSTSASYCGPSKVSFQIQHASLPNDHSVLKVKLLVEYSAALKGIRVNGLPQTIEERLDRELRSSETSKRLLQDASSAANISLSTASVSIATAESEASGSSSLRQPPLLRTDSSSGVIPRGLAFDKTILARVRRNYIYFSSLLQEPEAKWRRNSDVRGVSVTQLDSIDPTLVVYKAEATFVGVGLWDLYSTVVTPGARAYWDRQYEDAALLEDVNELTELWHYKTKPAWPVTGRDTVLLKTVYKSPTTVHVFSFSVDDTRLFPTIPPVDPGTIRTQVDLQGWAIEALNPTTTQLTLLEQSDPKGWTGKATVPQQMIASVAGVGEFAIKCGGPPVVTRLSGARSTSQRYDYERGLFRVEYEPAASRQPSPTTDSATRPVHLRENSVDSMQTASIGMITPQKSENATSASIECELRCDVDTWTTSLDIVIDPPPQSLTCLRRHRLSVGGGGLWLTVGHDISFASEERLQAIVRRAPLAAAKEKGIVMVNGKRINVDVEELPEAEMKSLSKQRRVKPIRVPLDQPPVMGVIRRRRAELEDGNSSDSSLDSSMPQRKKGGSGTQASFTSTVPKVPSPLSNFFTTAMEQVTNTTHQAVAALVPPAVPLADVAFPDGKKPMHYALDALAFVQAYHRGASRDNWITVSDVGLSVQRRLSPEISPIVPIHRGEKVVEGVTAEEVASVIFSIDCRKQWDDRLDSVSVLQEYGADCHTAFLVSKTGFPFRDRGFFLASLLARDEKYTANEVPSSETERVHSSPSGSPSAIFCVSASFNPVSAMSFATAKFNPHALPVGRVYMDAWIIQTLDPYAAENYTIPSTKCTRLAAVDFAGSLPVAFNSMINTSLPRAILALESYMKTVTPFPEMRYPAASFLVASDSIDVEDNGWAVHYRNRESTLLNSKLELSNKVFSTNLLVELEKTSSESPKSSSDDRDHDSSQTTPRSGRADFPSRPNSPDNILRRRGESVTSLSPSRCTRNGPDVTSSVSTGARSPSRERIKTSSSAFSIGRDQKTRGPPDFLVAKIIIDLRTYPDGYEVQLVSRLLPRNIPLRPLQLSQIAEIIAESDVLPITHSVYTLPPSPLYTSGGVDTPVRHLLRLALPTAQFEVPTVEDPLTGEIRNAPPKPQWYTDLENKEKRALVRVIVRPLPADKQKKGKKVVLIDGASVAIGGEKDVHKTAPSDDPSSGILSRVQIKDDEDRFSLPEQLSSPLAVEDSFLDTSTTGSMLEMPSGGTENQNDKPSDENSTEENDQGMLSESPGQITPLEEKQVSLPTGASRGLWGLVGSYQNPFALIGFGSGASTSGQIVPKTPDSYATPAPTPSPEPTRALPMLKPMSDTLEGSISASGGVTSSALAVVRAVSVPRYSISTLIACMLIAFLVGSLLRSLLSPADFIYVVTDLGDIPDGVTRDPNGGLGTVEPGWREIKRLVELKYIVGGWDFQVAVVRRH